MPSVVRSTTAQFVALVRDLIADQAGASQTFRDDQIQDSLDRYRDEVRYEQLSAMPVILNAASTNNIATVLWVDYKSRYQYWETMDASVTGAIQGNQIPGAGAWIVLAPARSDYITGRFSFQLAPFSAGVAPGQYPPVFATGQVFDVYQTAADLLEMWGAQLARSYDVSTAGVSLRRSQQQDALHKQADYYRSRARIRTVQVRRDDSPDPGFGQRVPILGSIESLSY